MITHNFHDSVTDINAGSVYTRLAKSREKVIRKKALRLAKDKA